MQANCEDDENKQSPDDQCEDGGGEPMEDGTGGGQFPEAESGQGKTAAEPEVDGEIAFG